MTALRAAIYTRVSDDRSGRARSPEEQEAGARRDCARAGWSVTEVVTDNDRGASRFSRGDRPGFDRLREMVAGGHVDVLVVWEASRLQRDLAAYVALRDLCRAHRVRWSYNGRLFDMDDADDAFNTGLDALLSERETGITSKRVRRAVAANVNAGRPHGAVLLGYRRVYDERTRQYVTQEPDPYWAPLVRGMFERVAAGHSLRQVAAWANAEGYRLPRTGTEWTGPRVGDQIGMRGESYLGHRMHHGKVAARDAWPPLVDEQTFGAALAVLSDPARRSAATGDARGLLVGAVRCQCGARVDCTSVGRAGRQYLTYRCQRLHLARGLTRVDDAIAALVVGRLQQPDALAAMNPRRRDVAPLQVDLDAARAQLADVEEQIVTGAMPAAMAARVATALEVRIEDAQRRLARAAAGIPRLVVELSAADAEERWRRLLVGQRRSVVAWLLQDVRLVPVGRGSRKELGITFRWVGDQMVHSL